MRIFPRSITGHDGSVWPVMLLFLTVLLPSAGVVWMMRAAMQNERLAVHRRLTDAYRVQLESAKRQLLDRWQETLRPLDDIVRNNDPPKAFARCVMTQVVDSLVVLNVRGEVAYPNTASLVQAEQGEGDPNWYRAARLEFQENQLARAVEAYRSVADRSRDPAQAAHAQLAVARCLLRMGDSDGAIQALQQLQQGDDIIDTSGRSLSVDAGLRLLELLEPASQAWTQVAARLRDRLSAYEASYPTADQRRFAMHRLMAVDPQLAPFATLNAEEMAAGYLEVVDQFPRAGQLTSTPVEDLWSVASTAGSAIALMQTATVERLLGDLLSDQPMPAGVGVKVRGPASHTLRNGAEDVLTVALGPTMPGWELSLSLADNQLLDDATDARTAFYAWTAAVLVGTTLAMTCLIATLLRRQLRVARLKNDLVATVSHELKTPLASIRLLVDTLLGPNEPTIDGTTPGKLSADADSTREYLEMIARENARLTRLIDNFLTFSRMDRGHHRFEFQSIDAGAVVKQAAATVVDRFDGEQAALEMDVQGPLAVRGDPDALVTAIVNLLDNAWKYTHPPKHVRLSAYRSEDCVTISVQDNGIGLTPRAARRVFDRFYQVDQRLSRVSSGCGLGLSIVRSIVEEHGGKIAVDSRPGQGSRFTIRLPVDKHPPTSCPLESFQTGLDS